MDNATRGNNDNLLVLVLVLRGLGLGRGRLWAIMLIIIVRSLLYFGTQLLSFSFYSGKYSKMRFSLYSLHLM